MLLLVEQKVYIVCEIFVCILSIAVTILEDSLIGVFDTEGEGSLQ